MTEAFDKHLLLQLSPLVFPILTVYWGLCKVFPMPDPAYSSPHPKKARAATTISYIRNWEREGVSFVPRALWQVSALFNSSSEVPPSLGTFPTTPSSCHRPLLTGSGTQRLFSQSHLPPLLQSHSPWGQGLRVCFSLHKMGGACCLTVGPLSQPDQPSPSSFPPLESLAIVWNCNVPE